MKLVTFGCSHTYGHGLPDCHIEPNMPGPKPSEFAWPNLLAQKLKLDVVNLSAPGIGNLHMLWKLLNYKFDNDDICIIAWTYFYRVPFSILTFNPKDNIFDPGVHDGTKKIKPGDIDSVNISIQNHLILHHAHLYLESKNINHYFVIIPHHEHKEKCPDVLQVPVLKDISTRTMAIDLALDNSHMGILSHKKIADAFAKRINVIH
jgi:hypothetical protein